MKKTSRIFSALLLGAVVVFGASSCAGKGEQAAEAPAAAPSEQTAAKGSIVYIDMTALMADYDMANDLRAVVETKVQNIQAEISRREKKFTDHVRTVVWRTRHLNARYHKRARRSVK